VSKTTNTIVDAATIPLAVSTAPVALFLGFLSKVFIKSEENKQETGKCNAWDAIKETYKTYTSAGKKILSWLLFVLVIIIFGWYMFKKLTS
jgi:Na+/H+ antiporter NhaC